MSVGRTFQSTQAKVIIFKKMENLSFQSVIVLVACGIK